MSRGKTAGLIGALLVLLVGGIAVLTPPSPAEPSFHGGRASELLEHFSIKNRKLGGDALLAMKALGPDAAPVIFRRLEASESLWQTRYRLLFPKVPARVAKFLPPPMAEFGRLDAVAALLAVGPAVEPALIKALKSRGAESRAAAACALASLLSANRAGIKDAVPALIQTLGDENASVRAYSIIALSAAGPEAAPAVPALIAILKDPDTGPKRGEKVRAAWALGKIGPEALPALPSLNPLLAEKDKYVQAIVAIAIWRIDGNVTSTLPVLSQALNRMPEGLKWEVIDAMGEMGPRAKAAVPLLLQELEVARQPFPSWTHKFGKITNALNQIDPEALAKARLR